MHVCGHMHAHMCSPAGCNLCACSGVVLPLLVVLQAVAVVNALQKQHGELEGVPLYALGASSGGAFALTLTAFLPLSGKQHLGCCCSLCCIRPHDRQHNLQCGLLRTAMCRPAAHAAVDVLLKSGYVYVSSVTGTCSALCQSQVRVVVLLMGVLAVAAPSYRNSPYMTIITRAWPQLLPCFVQVCAVRSWHCPAPGSGPSLMHTITQS